MNKAILFLLLAFAFCSSALADVYKCKGADGKTIYADEPCGRQATRVLNLDANTLPAIAAAKTDSAVPLSTAATQPQTTAQAPDTAPAFVANAGQCALARRNAETMASSFSADPKRIEFAEREVNIVCFGSAKASEIELARAAAPRVIIRKQQPTLRAPRYITYCQGTHCYDDLGGRHLR